MRLFRVPALALAALLVATVSAAASTATDAIDRLHATLLATMKQADSLGLDGRYRKLEPLLGSTFDFERMIAVAAGSYWTNADPEQRQRLLEAFSRLSVMTYAARFNGFNGESFDMLGERPGPRGSQLVDTRVNRSDGPPVPVTYVLTERDGAWRIVDVLLDRSISELAVRKSEYSQVLREGGPDRLVETLDLKTRELQK